MTTQSRDSLWIEEWLSVERFATYLHAARGSRELALKLYEWNTRINAELLHDLAHLEVGLRNHYDKVLKLATLPHEMHWTEQDSLLSLFPVSIVRNNETGQYYDRNKRPRNAIMNAIEKAQKTSLGKPTPGKIVAEVTFGFWSYLTSAGHEKNIWTPYLHKAFGQGTIRETIHHVLQDLLNLRNRIAHHEPSLVKPHVISNKLMYMSAQILPSNAFRHLQNTSGVLVQLKNMPH